MPFVTASDGTRLAYEVIGAGPPLLLVPGQSNDRSIWNGLREAFADRYRVVTFDHRGTGDQDAPRLLSPTEQDVRSAKRFLDETVNVVNARVGGCLAELLTRIHGDNPGAFVAQERANLVTNQFNLTLTVAGAVGVLT